MDEVPPSTECPGLLSRFPGDSWGPLGWGGWSLTESTSYPSSSPISLHPNHLQTGRSQKGLRKKKEKEGSNWARQWRSKLDSQRTTLLSPLLLARRTAICTCPFKWWCWVFYLTHTQAEDKNQAWLETVLESMVAHGCVSHRIQAQTPWFSEVEVLSQLQRRQSV